MSEVARPTRPGASASRPRQKFGEALVEAGVISAAQLSLALAEQRRQPAGLSRKRLGEVIVSKGFASEHAIAEGLAKLLGFEYLTTAALERAADPVAASQLPAPVARRLNVVPLSAGGSVLRLAVADPTDSAGLDEVRHVTRMPALSIAVAALHDIKAVLDRVQPLASPGLPSADGTAAAPVVADPEASAPRGIAAELAAVAGSDVGAAVSPSLGTAARSAAPATAPDYAQRLLSGQIRSREDASVLPVPVPLRAAAGTTGGQQDAPARLPAGARAFEYCFVGQGLASGHPGRCGSLSELEAKLAELGRNGWEMVSLQGAMGQILAALKRPLD